MKIIEEKVEDWDNLLSTQDKSNASPCLKCKASHDYKRLNLHFWEPGRPNSCNVILPFYLFNVEWIGILVPIFAAILQISPYPFEM